MRKMVKIIGISKIFVRRIVKKDLKLSSYKLGDGHYLSDEMKLNRLRNVGNYSKYKTSV